MVPTVQADCRPAARPAVPSLPSVLTDSAAWRCTRRRRRGDVAGLRSPRVHPPKKMIFIKKKRLYGFSQTNRQTRLKRQTRLMPEAAGLQRERAPLPARRDPRNDDPAVRKLRDVVGSATGAAFYTEAWADSIRGAVKILPANLVSHPRLSRSVTNHARRIP